MTIAAKAKRPGGIRVTNSLAPRFAPRERSNTAETPRYRITSYNVCYTKLLRKVAEAYLDYLYAPEGQRLAAKHFYRPIHPEFADPADARRFPKLKLVTLQERFGDWRATQARFFTDGAIFDQIRNNFV